MPSLRPRPRRTVIDNVTVFDGDNLEDSPRRIILEDGLISNSTLVAESDDIVDGTGCTLLPGLIDAHVHLQRSKDIYDLAAYGITTAIDMACWPKSRLDSFRGMAKNETLPEIQSPGLLATASGSIHSKVMPLPRQAMLNDPAQADAFVEERVGEGADFIKMIADIPGPSSETLKALVSAAHRHGKLVVAHAVTVKPWLMAVESGTDLLTHCPLDDILDDRTLSDMAARKQAVIPTLIMMEGMSKTPGLQALLGLLWSPKILFGIISVQLQRRRLLPSAKPRAYDNARRNVAEMIAAGIPILAGTDANSEPSSPNPVHHGSSLHREMELLVEAGLSTVDTLRAATSLPAQYFGFNDRGFIKPGKRADLILIYGNPLDDIRAVGALKRVWNGGSAVQSIVSATALAESVAKEA